jgi:hypothetical protein
MSVSSLRETACGMPPPVRYAIRSRSICSCVYGDALSSKPDQARLAPCGHPRLDVDRAVPAHRVGDLVGTRVVGLHHHQCAAAAYRFGVVLGVGVRYADGAQATDQAARERTDAGAGQRRGDRAGGHQRADARHRESGEPGDQAGGAADDATRDRAAAGRCRRIAADVAAFGHVAVRDRACARACACAGRARPACGRCARVAARGELAGGVVRHDVQVAVRDAHALQRIDDVACMVEGIEGTHHGLGHDDASWVGWTNPARGNCHALALLAPRSVSPG